jgi:hypothetical protein
MVKNGNGKMGKIVNCTPGFFNFCLSSLFLCFSFHQCVYIDEVLRRDKWKLTKDTVMFVEIRLEGFELCGSVGTFNIKMCV